MTHKMQEQIRALTLDGKQEREIADIVGVHRNTVYRAQKQMGLTLNRPGFRGRILTDNQKAEVLALLKSGWGTSRIGRHLGCGEHQVRLVVKKFKFRRKPGEVGCRYHLSSAKRARIVEDILQRRDFALNIALKHHVAYKIVLALAKQTLGCPGLRCGYGQPPLSSNFPQKNHRNSLKA